MRHVVTSRFLLEAEVNRGSSSPCQHNPRPVMPGVQWRNTRRYGLGLRRGGKGFGEERHDKIRDVLCGSQSQFYGKRLGRVPPVGQCQCLPSDAWLSCRRRDQDPGKWATNSTSC
ncbi:hypothetical protein C7M84_006645 [Penaeus vannamei]|uniref:Uncharacterized protein n=1 Tax=Penaeus vannamei TaxID=6689 RepID=A0A3R7N1N4_PENVA|nr:hypothetical protein C7M84_006645 [Penaeus vannamei]